jgi:hypothetical protein
VNALINRLEQLEKKNSMLPTEDREPPTEYGELDLCLHLFDNKILVSLDARRAGSPIPMTSTCYCDPQLIDGSRVKLCDHRSQRKPFLSAFHEFCLVDDEERQYLSLFCTIMGCHPGIVDPTTHQRFEAEQLLARNKIARLTLDEFQHDIAGFVREAECRAQGRNVSRVEGAIS